jgi:hypothetical protein
MRQRLVALAVVVVLGSLRTLAYADPPDQSWIGGFYDDADYDDVVILVTSTQGTAETRPLCGLEPNWTPVWILALADDRLIRGHALPPHQPRGPPAS